MVFVVSERRGRGKEEVEDGRGGFGVEEIGRRKEGTKERRK